MKKNVIYKSPGLYTKKELEEIKNDYDCRDITNGEYNDIDEEDIQEYNDVEWNYSFGDEASWKDTELDNQEIVVLGTLGLWNRAPKVKKVFDSLSKAISACLDGMDDVEIFEDQYGNLKIDGYHHDGCNHYILKKNGSRPKCLHFTKELVKILAN